MIKEKIKKLWHIVKGMLYPEYSCFCCGKELEDVEFKICTRCQKNLEKTDDKVCLVCGEPLGEINQFCDRCKIVRLPVAMVRSCYMYSDVIKKIVLSLKFGKKKYMAPFIAREMLLKLEDFGAMPDIVLPVPITLKRRKRRGFNQSELIAYEMERQSKNSFKVESNLVERIKDRPPQSTLEREDRMGNLKGAFRVKEKVDLKDKLVLIVDDVFTTGETVFEVASVVNKLNPKAVIVLTFARS